MVLRTSHPRFTGLCVLIAVTLLDQWSKHCILNSTLPREILPFFGLVLVHNRGISFGLLAQVQPYAPLLLTLATSAVALGLFVWLLRAHDALITLALGFIVGGALGNILDRLRMGAVTDFLDFHAGGYHWPAFNLADSAIFIGVVILVLMSIVKPSEGKKEEKK